MAVVLMVQMAVDEIIKVVTVGDKRVATVFPMDMARFVTTARMTLGACVGVVGSHTNGVLVDVVAMNVMQMTVV